MKIDMYEKVSAVMITSKASDFTGEDWKEAYFQLLSWKNTWGLPYEMDINCNKDGKAYLSLVVKKVCEDQTIEMLKDLGYGDIKVGDITLCELMPDYDENIDMYVIG